MEIVSLGAGVPKGSPALFAWRRSGLFRFRPTAILRATQPEHRRGGRVAEGDGLLNRYTSQKMYRGFESPPLRFLRFVRRRDGLPSPLPNQAVLNEPVPDVTSHFGADGHALQRFGRPR